MTAKKTTAKTAAAKEVKGEVAHVDTTVQVGAKDAPEKTTSESLGMVMGNQLASVTVGLGHTKNIGNYESFRVSVSVTVPCLNKQKNLDAAAEFAYSYANHRVTQIFNEAGYV